MNKIKTNSGIVSYGTYIPKNRIKVEEIAKTWSADGVSVSKGLGLIEKTVPAADEDTITNAVNSAMEAQDRIDGQDLDIGAIYVGSESHPYAVKPTATIVGEALGVGTDWTAADIEFACKAGTAAMQMVFSHIDAGRIKTGVAIGADTAQGAPGDALEYSSASGAAAFILGTEQIIAKLIHTSSFTSDTPDFWRREHEHFPKHGGRFTGQPAYLKHIVGATKKFLEETSTQISDYYHVVLHMPNGKFPKAAAKVLGITDSQLEAGFIVPNIGNTYSACSMLGIASVLDVAKPSQNILVTSYGSGSGADSFSFEVTHEIENFRKQKVSTLGEKIQKKAYVSYGEYVNLVGKLKG